MKKRLTAAFLSAVMAVTACVNLAVPVFARATPSEEKYEYRSTTGLEADYVDGKLILTWPTVDKEGNLLNQNPMRSIAQGETVKEAPNPMAGWSMPYRGSIIVYSGWNSAYTPTKASAPNLTGNETVIIGLVEGEAEGCQTVYDYSYPSGTTAVINGNKSHIDETVIANGYAKDYRVEYSADGENWTSAATYTMQKHSKNLYMPAVDGAANVMTDAATGWEYAQDRKATVFLVDQQVEEFPSDIELEEGETYYIRVVPISPDGGDIAVSDDFTTTLKAESSNTIKVPAYPTVEGGGIYATGGRSTLSTQGEVYVVTNLEDSVTNPPEGSLRYGLTHRKGEDVPLTIVFDVGGTIHIDPAASKSQRRFVFGSNITVAGQTAPGEGITIAGGTCNISGENVIMRYVRFRLGEGYDIDGANVAGKNIIIDHCTFSWGVDETFSCKELINATISYNIITGGLAMVNKNGDNTTDAELYSGEAEAKHGMGSIINGYNTTITHNIWAHNGTRNPRFEGGFEYKGKRYENLMEYANNVVYNWGHMSSYGGDRGTAQVNFEGNYYKTGPNTLEKVKNIFFDCDTDSTYGNVKSSYYINGNVMEGNDTLNADNTKGFPDLGTAAYKLDKKAELLHPYEATDAYTAYDDVLANAGASFKRDAQDDKLIAQIKNGTGRFINSEKEAGGYITIDALNDLTDSDGDGIPDGYETVLGSDPTAADSTVLRTDETDPFYGYTNIDIYINDILGEWGENSPKADAYLPETAGDRSYKSDSSKIVGVIDSEGNDILAVGNTDLILGETYTIKVANEESGRLYSVLFNDEVKTKDCSGEITVTPDKVGTYLMEISSYKNEGKYNPITLSDQVSITVLESKENIPDFTAADIGAVRQAGNVSYDSADGSIIIEGAGLIGRTSAASNNADDAFFFDYKEMTGDFDISARVNMWEKLDYYQKAGIMARASVTEGKPEFYMNAVTYIKGEDYEAYKGADGNSILARNIGPFVRTSANGTVSAISSSTIGTFMSVAKKRISEEQTPMYMRMTREGQTITLYGGTDGENWTTLASYETTLPETCYVGFAIDAAQDAMDFTRYNKAEITDVVINGVALGGESPEPTPDPNPDKGNGIVGDVDQNGILTANDSAALLAFVLNPEVKNEAWNVSDYIADVNNDSEITAADSAKILAKVLNSAHAFARTNA